jgi:hypothetical protein
MKTAFVEAKADCARQAEAQASAGMTAMPPDAAPGLDRSAARRQLVSSVMSSCMAARGFAKST